MKKCRQDAKAASDEGSETRQVIVELTVLEAQAETGGAVIDELHRRLICVSRAPQPLPVCGTAADELAPLAERIRTVGMRVCMIGNVCADIIDRLEV